MVKQACGNRIMGVGGASQSGDREKTDEQGKGDRRKAKKTSRNFGNAVLQYGGDRLLSSRRI